MMKVRREFQVRGTARGGRQGLTLLELCVAMSILAVAMLGYAKTVARTTLATRTSREAALANEAAKLTIESMRALALVNVYAMYNTSTADDPVGVVSPGANFAVTGLEALPGDVDGMAGEILLPVTLVGGVPELRENLVDPDFGMPSDLTGEGTIDALNHAADYKMLPVIVRVRWRGVGGQGAVEFQTILGGY